MSTLVQFVQTTGFYWYYTHSRSSLSRLLALDTLAFLLTLVPTEVDRGSRSDQRTSLRPSLALSIQALESHMFAKWNFNARCSVMTNMCTKSTLMVVPSPPLTAVCVDWNARSPNKVNANCCTCLPTVRERAHKVCSFQLGAPHPFCYWHLVPTVFKTACMRATRHISCVIIPE